MNIFKLKRKRVKLEIEKNKNKVLKLPNKAPKINFKIEAFLFNK